MSQTEGGGEAQGTVVAAEAAAGGRMKRSATMPLDARRPRPTVARRRRRAAVLSEQGHGHGIDFCCCDSRRGPVS